MSEGSQAGETGTSLPATWQGVNRNTGRSMSSAEAKMTARSTGSARQPHNGPQRKRSSLTKAGGQAGAGAPAGDPYGGLALSLSLSLSLSVHVYTSS